MLRVIMILVLLLGAAHGQEEADFGTEVEGILAVVGNELILKSELNDLLEYELTSLELASPPDTLVASLRRALLDQLIDDRLLLNHARERKTEVNEEEIETTLQERIDQIRSRFSSESAFIAQLEAEGLDMSRFRSLQRKAVEDQLLKLRLQEILRDEWRIQVSESDVRKFCDERFDEVPDNPEQVELHHILLKAGPDAAMVGSQDSLLRSIRERIENGEAFADLAREFSQDASSSLGGDLGRFDRGTMVPEFEKALDALEPGEVSGVVTTRFGMHLIQLIDKDKDSFQARHIILLLQGESDTGVLLELAQEIAAKADSVPLEELAGRYSADLDTKERGGLVGVAPISSIGDEAVRAVLDSLEERTLSTPVVQEDEVSLYWIAEWIPAGKPTCEEIAPGIRDLLYHEKYEAKLQELLQGLKEETFIDIQP